MKKLDDRFSNIPEWLMEKWQDIADLLAKIIDIPAALIMKTENEYMEVFISSRTENNPYKKGDKEKWYGLYCETVINSQQKLLVPNALIDEKWNKNPDIKLGMISYLGFPLNFPDKTPFGTICILDNKENHYSENYEQLILHFKSVIENDLFFMYLFDIKTKEFKNTISKQYESLKQRNIELAIAKSKAEESDRYKTAFLQNMSHELRTPLNAISGFSAILDKPNLSEDKRKSFVSIIQSSSNQLLSIVTAILTISSLETKQEKVDITNVCVNEIILELLAIFKQQSMTTNLSLYAKQQLNDAQSEVYTDKTKLTQILSNLVSNALKFTHEGFIEFGYNLKDKVLEFYVKDSGIGIEQEQLNVIFERFRQADLSINKKYGGNGLGLSISKGFVELLGGEIWVQSELGKGTTFYFTIPYNPVNESNSATDIAISPENSITVLIAEDVEYNFLLIEELLLNLNVKIIHAKDGQEAVDICKKNSTIDLVLMDIKMPNMDGYETAKKIKAFRPSLPIVAQSAYALEHEIMQYSDIFDTYLTKPLNDKVLVETVRKYIK